MDDTRNPTRSPPFRLITIAAAGGGSFMLGIGVLRYGLGEQIAGMPAELLGAVIAALCALAAASSSLSFFAGVDESAGYVYRETQLDKLTGLHARIAMVGKIAEAAAATIRTGQPAFLINIDVDRFKQINDAIGYGQGDALIRLIARRLKDGLPDNAVIGRIGAAEFAVLLPDRAGVDVVDGLMAGLIDHLCVPYRLPTHLQSVSFSTGLVAMPKDGTDPVALLRRSNLALQNARARGTGNWAVFDPDMGRVADHRQWIESELHAALLRGDFRLHYQPQLDLRTGRIVGYEALIRWLHPQHGMIAPMEFVPIAEVTGMIGPIGEWVLRTACADAAKLPEDCFVAVNISPVQFMSRDFVALVKKVMEETGISPRRLELEVTETAMMQDRERAALILRELSQMGLSVAVDDFGTGYSNLSYLIDFSFTKLKIDRSFVHRMEQDSNSGAVVSTILDLSRALGVRTIAEGVETQGQASLLRAAGCEVVQGFLFGQPAPLAIAGLAPRAQDLRPAAARPG